MANQILLNKLVETAKNSKVFSGFQEADIRQACQAYVDKSDEDVAKAIENLEKESSHLDEEEERKKKAIRDNQTRLIEAHKTELIEREKDALEAERLLKKLFQ